MKLGFTTLAVFMEPTENIINLAKKHEFDIIEILAEDPLYEKDNSAFIDCGLDIRMHGATVDINIASINKGIRAESVRQMIHCGQYAEKIGANTITVHPGIIGRNEPQLRKWALKCQLKVLGKLWTTPMLKFQLKTCPSEKNSLETPSRKWK